MRKALIVIVALMLCGIGAASEIVRQKNAATYLYFPIVDVNGAVVSSAAGLDSEIDTWGDGAAPDGFADCTNEATEVGSTGWYYLSVTAGEVNVDYAAFRVQTSTDGALDQHLLVRTIVGDVLNIATTDDGGTINVTGGAVDEASTMSQAGIDEMHDDLLTNNKVKNSLGYWVQRTKGGQPVDLYVTLLAQNGGTTNTIVLNAVSSSTDNAYRNMLVELATGAGAPATRTIVGYDGGTKIAVVNENWPGANPDSTTAYTLWAAPSSELAHEGLAQAGDATTITLAADAPDVNDISGWVKLRSGTGAPDTQEIADYDGTTKVLTVSGWTGASPDNTTYYAIVPTGNIVSDSTTPTAGITSEEVKAALMTATYDDYTDFPGTVGWLFDLLMRKP